MEHFYEEIDGWFDYEEIYRQILEKLPHNSVIVELGCWRGKSSSYLAVEALNQDKNFELHFVDTWGGSPEHYVDSKLVEELNEDKIFDEFTANLSRVPYPYKTHRMNSLDAAKLFENNSVDFVFFDTNHSFGHVSKELRLWYPKLKKGGILSGHDYGKDTALAVNQFFGNQTIEVFVGKIALSWITEKKDNSSSPPKFRMKF